MAEYDCIELFSNYQSYNVSYDKKTSPVKCCLKNRIAWNNKRKKNNYYANNITAINCQELKNSYHSMQIANNTTQIIPAQLMSDKGSSQTSLITNHQDNNKNKCVIMEKSHCINDIDNNKEKKYSRRLTGSYNKSNVFTLVLLLAIGLLFKINLCCGFILDGTQNSYAQFRKWYTGLNGTLELEFKTEQPNGLVLYTDDGGTYDFFELKLVEGALRLRYNLGGGAQIITVGRDLHDGHWHKVQVS